MVHRTLGGLTTGAVTIMWSGVDGHLVRLRDGVYPKRRLTKFVDIAADLPRGLTRRQLKNISPVWHAQDDIPFPWPPPVWPVVVRVPAVFVKDELVVHALSVKEACQLMDVPGTWPENVVRNIWTWSQGHPFPL
jgi:hypothetical protein